MLVLVCGEASPRQLHAWGRLEIDRHTQCNVPLCLYCRRQPHSAFLPLFSGAWHGRNVFSTFGYMGGPRMGRKSQCNTTAGIECERETETKNEPINRPRYHAQQHNSTDSGQLTLDASLHGCIQRVFAAAWSGTYCPLPDMPSSSRCTHQSGQRRTGGASCNRRAEKPEQPRHAARYF